MFVSTRFNDEIVTYLHFTNVIDMYNMFSFYVTELQQLGCILSLVTCSQFISCFKPSYN